jgi:Flp pilus assembly protein TadB
MTPQPPDYDQLIEQDKERFRRLERRDMDTTAPALIEIVFFGLACLVVVAWLAAMFVWVPQPIDGTTWMSLGALGMVLFGGPGVAIYWLRRGGARDIARFAEQLTR